jgi:radical SAM protein (TIGR01212 family)
MSPEPVGLFRRKREDDIIGKGCGRPLESGRRTAICALGPPEFTGMDWRETIRYNAFSRILKAAFGEKVYKITVDGGFSCPNRDGTIGTDGCIYCINESFSPSTERTRLAIHDQLESGKKRVGARYGARKFIAYFQPFTNTYSPVGRLRALYDEALAVSHVVGLSIGTRPDCVPEEVLDLLEEYHRRTYLWVEYGLQSVHDRTLERIHRGHDYAAFLDALERTKRRGLRVCVHVILGLPGETRRDMMETARALAGLGIDGVKIHHLYVARGAPLEESYRRGEVALLSEDQFVGLAVDFLERLSPEVVIHRLTGEARWDFLMGPVWKKSKGEILSDITEELRRRDAFQGSRCGAPENGEKTARRETVP